MPKEKKDKEEKKEDQLLQKVPDTPEPEPKAEQPAPEPLLPLPIPPEVFDHNEMFAKRLLPRIYHSKDSSSDVIVNQEKYVITDISPRSSRDENKIVWTQIFAIIAPLSQLEPVAVDDGNIKYSIVAGSGSVTVENVSKPIERNNIFVVEKGVTHSIINTNRQEPLAILIDYSGTDILDLRDLYKPIEQMTKKAQVSRERVMNVQNQPKREEVKESTTFKRKVVTEDLFV